MGCVIDHTCTSCWICPSAEVFGQGMWSQLKEIEDPELRELASALPDIVLQGKAPATVKKYSGAFLRWKLWAERKKEVCVFPASALHISLYLSYLIQKADSIAPVEQAVYALAWVHSLAGIENPTQHPQVKQVLAGAKRILARATEKKETISAGILQKLVSKYGGKDAGLSDICTLTICLMSFAGFLRYSEIANLKEADVSIYEDHMELYIESSKTDQFRDGAWVVIARICSELYP